MADKALAALDAQQDPQFVPERWTKVYRDWLVNLKDWCISRQLWWGHQIPAWYIVSETEGEIRDDTPFVVAMNETEAINKAAAQKGGGGIACVPLRGFQTDKLSVLNFFAVQTPLCSCRDFPTKNRGEHWQPSANRVATPWGGWAMGVRAGRRGGEKSFG